LGAALALALAISGCAGSGGGVAADAPLDVYLSVPLSGPGSAAGERIEAEAKRALAEAGGKAESHPIELKVLDATGGTGAVNPVAVGANARQATEDADTIAYIGEVETAASATSLPITGMAEIPQILLGPTPGGLGVDNVVDISNTHGDPGAAAIDALLQAVGRVAPSDLTRTAVRDQLRKSSAVTG
jgi:branched-chain amino acid transport system substrate-binding protein